jgi:hypothetical protein
MIVNRSNLIFQGVSGSLGNLTFSQRNGKTVISRRRGTSTAPPTEKQIAAMERFKTASRQALLILGDPAKRAFYEAKSARKKMSAYALAVRDAYHLLNS